MKITILPLFLCIQAQVKQMSEAGVQVFNLARTDLINEFRIKIAKLLKKLKHTGKIFAG